MEKIVRKFLFVFLFSMTVSFKTETIPFSWNEWKNVSKEIYYKVGNLLPVNGRKCLVYLTKQSLVATVGRSLLLSGLYHMIPVNGWLQVIIPSLAIEQIIFNRNNHFMDAIDDNDVKKLTHAIHCGADVNEIWQCQQELFFYNTTPLISAINNGCQLNLVKVLVHYTEDINKTVSDVNHNNRRQRITALITAVRAERPDIVALLLENNADTTIKDDDVIGLDDVVKEEEERIRLLGLQNLSEDEKRGWRQRKEKNKKIIQLIQGAHQEKTTKFLKKIFSGIQEFNNDLEISRIIASYSWPIQLTEEN